MGDGSERPLEDQVPRLNDQTRKLCADKPQAEAVQRVLGCFGRSFARMRQGTFCPYQLCGGGGRLQDSDRLTWQTSGLVLVRIGRRKNPGLASHSGLPPMSGVGEALD